jgi:hypothetical protein
MKLEKIDGKYQLIPTAQEFQEYWKAVIPIITRQYYKIPAASLASYKYDEKYYQDMRYGQKYQN